MTIQYHNLQPYTVEGVSYKNGDIYEGDNAEAVLLQFPYLFRRIKTKKFLHSELNKPKDLKKKGKELNIKKGKKKLNN